MPTDSLLELKAAIKGLLYMSKTDSPFEIVHWEKRDTIRSSADLLSVIGQSSGMPVENVGLGEFFHDLIQDNDWHDAEAKKAVEKYRHLLTLLNEHLTDLRVFKVGEGEIDIYVVGRTAEGDWAGIMTTTVET
jgi:hypothetical protein